MSEAAQEIALLRGRLAEAEETLRAIREGEVDALLVRGAGQDQVFHLGDDSATYRAFMEAMDLGAAALDEDGRLLYANSGLAKLFGSSAEALVDSGLEAALGAASAERVASLVAEAARERQTAQITVGDGKDRRHLVVTAAPLPLNFGIGRALTFTDITDRVRAEAAAESERIGRAIMTSSHEPVIVCDADGRITQASPAVLKMLVTSPVGRSFGEAIPITFAPATGLLHAEDLVDVALTGGSVNGVEGTLNDGAEPRDLIVSAAPLRHAGGEVGGCLITLMDVSERKALEKRQTLLMRELDHRMKNMLTMVASISMRTIANSAGLAEFRERFGQRLSALAATQTLLAARAWTSLSLADLIEAELTPYMPAGSKRVVLERLDFQVSRDAAVALGLVFHELVTNAVKYGALSGEAGQVQVSAVRLDDGTTELVWRETGGPAVRAPEKIGFGQTVIARGLGSSAARPTAVEFAASGLICQMTLSRDALA